MELSIQNDRPGQNATGRERGKIGYLFILLMVLAWGWLFPIQADAFRYQNAEQGHDFTIIGLGIFRQNYTSTDGPKDLFEDSDDGLPEAYSNRSRLSIYGEGQIYNDYTFLLKSHYDEEADDQINEKDFSFLFELRRDQHFMILGDHEDGTFQDTVFTALDEQVRGVTLHAGYSKVGATIMAGGLRGETTTDEIRGDGTSGPYRLEEAPVIGGSETVIIEIRDRANPNRVIQRRTQARGRDYRIDYDDGEIINVDNVNEWVTGFRVIYPEYPFGIYSYVYTFGYYDESMRQTILDEDDPDGSLRVESENCASATQTSVDEMIEYTPRGPSCDDIWVKTELPYVSATKRSVPYTALVVPGETFAFAIYFSSALADEGLGLNPVVVDVLPPEVTYVPGSATYLQTWLDNTGMPEPVLDVVDDYKGSGRQALIWTWPNGETIPPGVVTNIVNSAARFVEFDVTVAFGTPVGTYTNEFWITDGVYGDPDLAYCNRPIGDPFDIDNDGDTDENKCYRNWSFTVAEAAAMEATKWVRGDADIDWVRTPDIGSVDPSGTFEYRIDFANTGNVDLADLIFYDILPFVGDTGVSEPLNSPRASEWTPVLAGPVGVDVAPYSAVVSYSQSSNPCRPEVYPSGPDGCDDDWSTTVPGDLATVRALKFDLGGSVVPPSEGFSFSVPFGVPLMSGGGNFVGLNEMAWNSFAYTGSRGGDCQTNCEMLILEPLKVGVQIPPASISGLISRDSDGDGVQDDASEGLSGIAMTAVCTDVYDREVTYTTTTSSDGTTDVDGDGVIDPAGSYFFGDLLPGTCQVSVDETDLPTNLQGNNTLDPDGTLDSTTSVTVETGNHITDQDFAYSSASIDVEKATNGVDADETDYSTAPEIGVAAPVTWTYLVTNDGESHLADVAVTDDQLNAADIDCGGGSNVIPLLLIDASVTCTVIGTAQSGQYENTASVTGRPVYVDVNGAVTGDVPNVDPPTDEDLSHYVGIPAAIGNTVWLDIDGDGVEDGGDEIGLAGATVSLTGTDDFGNVVSLTTTDANGNYLFEGLATGTYTVAVDVSTVTNLPAGVTVDELVQTYDPDGTLDDGTSLTLAPGEDSLDQDFGYIVLQPSISIEKSTNGEDADTPTGPSINEGGAVTWTYVVINTGNNRLDLIAITDDQGVSVSCPRTSLIPGESMTCTGAGVATAGQYTNNATVHGTPVDANGNPLGSPVTNEDRSHYFGVALTELPPPPEPPDTLPPLLPPEIIDERDRRDPIECCLSMEIEHVTTSMTPDIIPVEGVLWVDTFNTMLAAAELGGLENA